MFIAGWFTWSPYAKLGGTRGVAQTISYEVRFFLMILCVVLAVGAFTFDRLYIYKKIWFFFCIPLLASAWFLAALAEANRNPFDFAEGESEIVGGFNTEYGSRVFAVFFIAEYGFILYIRLLFPLLFLGSVDNIGIFSKCVLVLFAVV